VNMLEALKEVHQNPGKIAVPIIRSKSNGYPYVSGIHFDPQMSWCWADGRKAGLPTPILLFGEWEVVDKEGYPA